MSIFLLAMVFPFSSAPVFFCFCGHFIEILIGLAHFSPVSSPVIVTFSVLYLLIARTTNFDIVLIAISASFRDLFSYHKAQYMITFDKR